MCASRPRRLASGLVSFVLLAVSAPPAHAQVPHYRGGPREYAVEIRYRIEAARSDRIRQFRAMMSFLDRLGFRQEDGSEDEAEDPAATRLRGTIDSANAYRILAEPHVRSILLIPAGFKLPEKPDQLAKVSLELFAGLPTSTQLALEEQTRARLALIGFHESVGYDNRRHTRMLGTIPVGRLDLLLQDLRWQPGGWLLPDVPFAELPVPLRNVSPLVATEVLAQDVGEVRDPYPPAPPSGEAYRLKVTADLRDLAAQGEQSRPVRMEVILNFSPAADDVAWRRGLTTAAPGLLVEGRTDEIVSVLAAPHHAFALARLGYVSTVRLPRAAVPGTRQGPVEGADNARALAQAGLDKLGRRGRGIRVAVIDADFRGWDRLSRASGRGTNGPPALLDLTAEHNRDLRPDAYALPPGEAGHGTQCVAALLLAAPGAEVTAVRIDPAAPYQLLEAARFINGDTFEPESLARRNEELTREREALGIRRDRLEQERTALRQVFGDDPEVTRRREAFAQAEAKLDADTREYQGRLARFSDLYRQLRALKGVRVVSCSLNWDDGYPLGGASAVTRYLDEEFRAAWWFQSEGNTRGQSWAGVFRDVDGNGVMEFAPPEGPRPEGRWTRELNFLGWQPFGKGREPELPAKARARVSVQWREPHDPEFFRRGEDLYREPLAALRLVVLRQRDPSGEKYPTDDLEVIARSETFPQRIDNRPESATYEVAVEFPVDEAGRYALRVEGRVAPGIRPASAPTPPAVLSSWDLQPRIFVEFVDAASRGRGRPVFFDYRTPAGDIGLPADAHQVVTVGAADFSGEPDDGLTGMPVGLGLLYKPNVRSYDRLEVAPAGVPVAFGADLATPFAAGLVTAMPAGGFSVGELMRSLEGRPARVLRLPDRK